MTCGEHKEIPAAREVGISQHGCGNVFLLACDVSVYQATRQSGADGAHGDVDRASPHHIDQSTMIESDGTEGVVVGQRAHDQIARGQIRHAGGGLNALFA